MSKPIINDKDVIYTYKEQYFTGFAPCFQNGIYSLACCKGNKSNGGMRASICKQIADGKSVWVLAIAGSEIRDKDHNSSINKYDHEDAIYLAKITCCYTWKEYSDKYFKVRKDAIYTFQNGKIMWNDNNSFGGNGEHKDPDNLLTDCAACIIQGKKYAFNDFKQVLMSNEYYIFKNGHKIPDSLNVRRNYSYNGKDRAINVIDFLEKNDDFIYNTGEDPFIYNKEKTGGCRR